MAITLAKWLGGMVDIVGGFRPVDMDTAGNTGDFVSLKNWHRCLIFFHSAIGTAGQDPTLDVQQATDNAGGGVKDLTFDTIYRKQAATDLLSTGTWTKSTQTAAANFTDVDAAEQEAMWVVEIKAEDLDVDGGFNHIRAKVDDDFSNPQLGALYYILCDPAYPNAPENVLSPL